VLNALFTSTANINKGALFTSPDLDSPKRLAGCVYSDQAVSVALRTKRVNTTNAGGAYATLTTVTVPAATQTAFDFSVPAAWSQIVVSNNSGSNTTDFSIEAYEAPCVASESVGSSYNVSARTPSARITACQRRPAAGAPGLGPGGGDPVEVQVLSPASAQTMRVCAALLSPTGQT
jgi:hypothetical protein